MLQVTDRHELNLEEVKSEELCSESKRCCVILPLYTGCFLRHAAVFKSLAW